MRNRRYRVPASEGLLPLIPLKDVVVFHAGTRQSAGKYLTSGGRVLGVTGSGETIHDAINNTYKAVSKIKFDDMHYRRDIAKRALTHSGIIT